MDEQLNQSGAAAGQGTEAANLLRQEFHHVLKVPVEVKTPKGALVDTITEITMKRPKGRHLRAMDGAKGEFGKVLALVSATSGVPMSVCDELDAVDVAVFAEAIADFFGVALPTG